MSEYLVPSLAVLLFVAVTLAGYAWLLASMYNEARLALEPGERVRGKGYASLARDNGAPLNLDSWSGCLFWTDRRLMWRPLFASFGSPIDIWVDGVSLEGQDSPLFNYRLWVRTDEMIFRFTVARRRNRDAVLKEHGRAGEQVTK